MPPELVPLFSANLSAIAESLSRDDMDEAGQLEYPRTWSSRFQ